MSKKRPKRPAAPPEPVTLTSSSNAPATSTPFSDLPWWRQALKEPVALGLPVLILVRPWLDGITYPTDNFYFLWGILLLFALWAARMMMRGETIHFGVPILLLGGFWAVAAVTAFGTVQFDTTYRALVLYAGHLALFILVTNAVRTRTAIGIVLGAFVIASLAETVWSLVHFKYVLPYVRQSINEAPHMLRQFFNTNELNPELKHRLEVNRAFGSLLFPNALAALMVLGIPYAFTGGIHGIRTLAQDMRAKRAAFIPTWVPAVSGAATWLVVVCVSYFLYSFIATFEFPLPGGLERVAYLPVVHATDGGYALDSFGFVSLWFLFLGVVPLLIAAAAAYTTWRYGIEVFGHALRAWVLPPLCLLEVIALWFTYSRGGLIALAAAALFTAVLVIVVPRLRQARRLRLPEAATVCLLFALMLASLGQAQLPGPPAPEAASTETAMPGPTLPAPPQPGAFGPPPAPAGTRVSVEGIDLTMQDLMNPASFWLRLTYWQTGLTMARDNFWHGVGLGNFGVAYPKYQRPGASDTKAAHNDYLQALCETGIFGGLLFCAFWAYFVIWGARRLLRETDAFERGLLGGLYAGVLAFLLHSLVDFDFFNPALAFFAVLMAGLFYSRASVEAPAGLKRPRLQLMGIPLLIAAAIIAGMSARVYLCDFIIGGHNFLNVGNNRQINAVLDAGAFFLKGLEAGPSQEKRYPMENIITVARLIPDRDVLESFGKIIVPGDGPNSRARQLGKGEPVPETARVVITKPVVAQQKAAEFADAFLSQLEVADGIFPHNPDLAAYFIQWYDLLADSAPSIAAKQRYTMELLRWSEIGIKRSPAQSVFHEWYAKALWLRGNIETGPSRKDYFEQGIQQYRLAAELYPSASMMWRHYRRALKKYGDALIAMGDKAKGEAMLDQSAKALQHALELERAMQLPQ